MKYVFLFFFYFFSNILLSQGNFNRYFESNFTPTFVKGYLVGNDYFYPYIFIDEDTTISYSIFSTDLDSTSEFIIDGFRESSDGLKKIENTYFGFAKNIDRKKVSFIRLNFSDLDNYDLKEITTQNFRNCIGGFTVIENNLYALNTNDTNQTLWNGIDILKVDTLGKLLWSKELRSNDPLFGWDIMTTLNGQIVCSYYCDDFDCIARLDTTGNVVWEYQSEIPVLYSSLPINIVELSNGKILEIYPINRAQQNIGTGFNTEAYMFRWLNSYGSLYKEKVINVLRLHEMFIFDVEKTGSGFYTYGFYNNGNDEYNSAHITKYNIEGDTIWTRRYSHPDFPVEEAEFWINDIIEKEDKSIIVFGQINYQGARQPWIFSINEDGCFNSENCEVNQVTSTSKNTSKNESIEIFPNPFTSVIRVKDDSNQDIHKIEVYNSLGSLVKEYLLPETSSLFTLNCSNLKNGFHYFLSRDKNGQQIDLRPLIKK